MPPLEHEVEWLAGLVAGALGLVLLRFGIRRLAGSRAVQGRAARRAVDHDRFLDLLKTVGIVTVVLGHWLAVYIERSPSGVHGDNILALDPWLWPVTWVVQVMPVFFVAGGAANAIAARAAAGRGDTYADFLVSRLARLLRPVLVLCGVWVAVLVVLHGLGVAPEYPALLGRLVGQPLWFLAVYILVIAFAPATLALHRRRPLLTLVALLLGVLAADVARLALGWTAAGFVNLALVWVLLHQLGYWYADQRLQRVSSRAYLAVVGLGLGALVALVLGPYPTSMVGLPGAPVSNMNPPTVCIVVLGTVQTAIAMLWRDRLDRWLRREGPWTVVSGVGGVAMPAYLWHLSAVAVVGGLLVISDFPSPAAGGVVWWLSRPLWIAACALVLVPIVMMAMWLDAAVARLQPLGTPSRAIGASAGQGVLAGLAALLASFGLFGFVVAGVDPLDPTGGRLITLPVTAAQSLVALALAWLLLSTVGYLDVKRPRATQHPGQLT